MDMILCLSHIVVGIKCKFVDISEHFLYKCKLLVIIIFLSAFLMAGIALNSLHESTHLTFITALRGWVLLLPLFLDEGTEMPAQDHSAKKGEP